MPAAGDRLFVAPLRSMRISQFGTTTSRTRLFGFSWSATKPRLSKTGRAGLLACVTIRDILACRA